MKPEVLVLDEPAAGLDPVGRDSIFESIMRYRRETGATVVIVSHSMEDMARLCDELIVMARAKVVMQGNCAEIFSRAEELEEIGLAVPQITKLISVLRQRGVAVDGSFYTVADAARALAAIMKQ
jgi:energy-coupling factor transport system ATP-binding protein